MACKLLVLHDNLGVVTITMTRDPVRLDDWVQGRDGEYRPEERREAMTGRDLRKACQDAEITALLLVSFRLERMRPLGRAGEQLLSPEMDFSHEELGRPGVITRGRRSDMGTLLEGPFKPLGRGLAL